MNKKKIALRIAVVFAVLLAVLAGLAALLQSARAVNTIAGWMEPLTGLSMHVDDISIHPPLNIRVNGLRVQTLRDRGYDLSLDRAEIHAAASAGLNIQVEKILLTGPKFTFFLKKEKTDTDPFAVLRKLPPVRLLEMKDGELELKTESSAYVLPGMDLTIRDFNPEGGGRLYGKSRFDVRTSDMAGRGSLGVSLDLSRLSPRPSGAGSLQLSLESGSFGQLKITEGKLDTQLGLSADVLRFDGASAVIRNFSRSNGSERISIQDIKTKFNLSYNQKTSGFSLTSFEASGADAGSLKGQATGTVKPGSWNATLRAFNLNLSRIFSLVNPLLPEDYRDWTFQGKGTVDLETEGRYADGSAVWKAAAVIDLSEGAFASADHTKAGERITGRIEMKLGSPEKKRKGRFTAKMTGKDGEILWGQYYQDFKGQRLAVDSQGFFETKPFSLNSSGTFDLFQTGSYAFTADLSRRRTIFSLTAQGVTCLRLFGALLQNYVTQNYPNLQDLSLEGTLDLKLTASLSPDQKVIEGDLSLQDGTALSPSNGLALSGLTIRLPYDLVLSGRTPAPPAGSRRGFMAFKELQKGRLTIGELHVPVVLSGNRFLLPEPVVVSLFGGELVIHGLRVDHLLFPDMNVEASLSISRLNLGEVIALAAPIALEGDLNGDLSPILFREGKWTAGGSLVARVFGGRITIDHLSAGRIFSPSRFFGADVAFDAIDLEEVTSNIKIGRMTGLIQGSLKNFTMEYGQPSRFDLVITSDRSRKVPQAISVDAIKNLSIISTGSETISDILNSGLNRFFSQYPYSEIGIRCTLSDDLFSLRGLIREGGKEYLIRRSTFRGIDMVNQNPDNSISFKDMSERMGRLFQPRQQSKDVPSG